ncbi:MAG TPA: hypothetical protein VFN71_16035 [Methylomirabilota bacterium]|nr:hypothetical protein [Methylomirabilota bacterium]
MGQEPETAGDVLEPGHGVRRLLDDVRVMGPSSIERIAWGWTRYAEDELDAVDAAFGRSLEALREAGLEGAWLAAESELQQLTLGAHWQAEDATTHRRAAEAVTHATMALLAAGRLDGGDRRLLVKATSEALPWLLPDERPDEYREPKRPSP